MFRLLMLLLLACGTAQLRAQGAQLLAPRNLARWDIPAGHYSGLTPLGRGLYAVVSDKGGGSGLQLWRIVQDSLSGKLRSVGVVSHFELSERDSALKNPTSELEKTTSALKNPTSELEKTTSALKTPTSALSPAPSRPNISPSEVATATAAFSAPLPDSLSANRLDPEALAYVPTTGQLLVASEAEQRIRAWDFHGRPTGVELRIPEAFARRNIRPNRGFEALCFDSLSRQLYTLTEQPLAHEPSTSTQLRLLSFDTQGHPTAEWHYACDAPKTATLAAATQVWGVSELCALPNGELLVLEREVWAPRRGFPAHAHTRLYQIAPLRHAPALRYEADTLSPTAQAPNAEANKANTTKALPKRLVAEWRTELQLWHNNLSNDEGLALGIRLRDGRQSLLVMNDSQQRYGKLFRHLQDYLRVLILPLEATAPR